MKTNKDFVEDIMLQQFTVGSFYNPTRYMLVYAFLDLGLSNIYEKESLVNYLFMAFCNNKDIAKRHPNLEIRNVPYYGTNVIRQELDNALIEWKSNAKNDTLSFDIKNVYLNVNIVEISIAYLKKALQVLFKKNFNAVYNGVFDMNSIYNSDDKNLDSFGISPYRDLVFSDMQYCVICDECNRDELYAVHIIKNQDGTNKVEQTDKNNGLLMCKKHALMYNDGKFSFDARGHVLCNEEELSNMRISKQVFQTRKKYFLRLDEANK